MEDNDTRYTAPIHISFFDSFDLHMDAWRVEEPSRGVNDARYTSRNRCGFWIPSTYPLTELRVEDSSRGNNDLRYIAPLYNGFGIFHLHVATRCVEDNDV